MKRIIILLFLLASTCSLLNIACAQTYSLYSFDGNKVKVNLSYNPSRHALSISCLKDTIFLIDYVDVNEVKLLDSKFLQVTYAKRAGSNEDLTSMLLLCVADNKLCQAIHIKSGAVYDMRNIHHVKGSLSEYQMFKAKAQLFGKSKSTYKLVLNIHDESSSERNPKANHSYNKLIVLNFDSTKNIFYKTRQTIAKSFTVYNPKSQHLIKVKVNGVVPVMNIEKEIYYYIYNEWYEKGVNANLLKYICR